MTDLLSNFTLLGKTLYSLVLLVSLVINGVLFYETDLRDVDLGLLFVNWKLHYIYTGFYLSTFPVMVLLLSYSPVVYLNKENTPWFVIMITFVVLYLCILLGKIWEISELGFYLFLFMVIFLVAILVFWSVSKSFNLDYSYLGVLSAPLGYSLVISWVRN